MKKHFMMQKVTKDSLLSLLDQSIVSLSNFSTGIIIGKTLTPDGFGIYSLFFAGIMVFSGIQSSLITGPLRVLGVRPKGIDGSGYFKAQLYLQLLMGSLLFIGSIIFLSIFSSASDSLVVSFGICLFFFQLQELTRVINITKFALKTLLLIDVLNHGLRLGILLLLVAFGLLTTTSTFLVIAAASTTGALIFINGIFSQSVKLQPIIKTMASNWNYGRWLLLESVTYSASTQIYLYFTAIWVDIQSTAALSAVQNILNIVNVLLVGGISIAVPVARQRLIEIGYLAWCQWLWKVGLVLTGGTAMLCLIVSVFAEPLLTHLYTPFFGNFWYLVPIMSISYCFRAVNTVLVTSFRTANLPQVGFAAHFISSIVTIMIASPLLSFWGVGGAAIGLAITQILWTVVYLFYVKRGYLLEENVMVRLKPNYTSSY